jgi:hypothetical protein
MGSSDYVRSSVPSIVHQSSQEEQNTHYTTLHYPSTTITPPKHHPLTGGATTSIPETRHRGLQLLRQHNQLPHPRDGHSLLSCPRLY